MWKIRQISGIYDLHGVITIFYSMLQMEPTLLVQTSCCNTIYELDPEVGKAIARGEQVEIQPGQLTKIGSGNGGQTYKRCRSCGYETKEDFEYCPKCGNRF